MVEYTYGKKVVITEGFYKGQTGKIIDFKDESWIWDKESYGKLTIRLEDGERIKEFSSNAQIIK